MSVFRGCHQLDKTPGQTAYRAAVAGGLAGAVGVDVPPGEARLDG